MFNGVNKVPFDFKVNNLRRVLFIVLRKMDHSDGEREEPEKLFDQEVVVTDRDMQTMPTDLVGGENMDLTRLTRLSLCDTLFSTVPACLGLLTNLSSLELADNKLTDLPEELGQLRVNRLIVAGNQLSSLPSCFYLGLSDVRELNISRNKINSLVTPPLCAAKLRTLDFSDNLVSALPEWLSTSCGALSSLSAARNGALRGVANGAVLRTPLRHLDLAACAVVELDFLAAARCLVTLRLGNVAVCHNAGNRFWDFPDVILQSADTLSELSLRGTCLSQLPPGIGALRSLALLDLRDCELHTLPTEVGQLSGLHTLLLSNNHLVSLPDSMADLRSLRQLHIDGNQMELLPAALSRLSGLELLDVYDNRLDQWDSGWLDALTSLQALDLERNHCQAEDSEHYVELRRCLRLCLNAHHRLVGCKPGEEWHSEDEDSGGSHPGLHYEDYSDCDGYQSEDNPQSEQGKAESDWGDDNDKNSSDDEWTPPDNWTVGSLHRVKMLWPPPIFPQKTFVQANSDVSAGQFTELTEH